MQFSSRDAASSLSPSFLRASRALASHVTGLSAQLSSRYLNEREEKTFSDLHGQRSVSTVSSRTETYKVFHQVVHYLLLTSNWKSHFSIWSLYCDWTFILMSTKGSVQPDGTPCRGEEVILQRNFLATLQELRDSDRPALVPSSKRRHYLLQLSPSLNKSVR